MPLPPRVSDHFDGRRFHNPDLGDRPDRRGLWQILRWRFGATRVEWPSHVTNAAWPPPAPPGPGQGRGPGPGQAAITFIGHASFLIRLPGCAILTDPVFSDRASPVSFAGPRRVRPPGLTLAALPKIDLILLSHNHYDHADLASLRTIRAAHNPACVTLAGNAPLLARAGLHAHELDWWQQTEAAGLSITALPARHFSRRGLFDGNRALWGGFMLRTAAHGPMLAGDSTSRGPMPAGDSAARGPMRGGDSAAPGPISTADSATHGLMFAGDSAAGPHWAEIRQRLGAPDLALLPIGAYDPRWLMAPVHMNPEEAVQAHLALAPRHAIGMHFGTFRLTDEAIDEPVRRLAAECARLGIANFTTLDVGETRTVNLAA